jgi:hypothetical protein
VIRITALAALLALSGCGAAIPIISGVAGAGAAIFRFDTAALDFVEDLEGRKAIPKSVSTGPRPEGTPATCLPPVPVASMAPPA